MSSSIEMCGVHVAPELVCLEGIDSVRIHNVCDYLSSVDTIATPYLFQLANDKTIRQALFHKTGKIRDSQSEAMCMLANRRSCLAVAANTTSGNVEHLVLRMHLLCSFSMLRDDRFPVRRWVDYVLLTFEDALPGKFVVIGGSVEQSANGECSRKAENAIRDYNRRLEALNALVSRVPSIRVLAIDDPEREATSICRFILGKTT